ncbi:hypothetical protein APHAL10511_000502 [Amanita phalloides]|nr:hypothetical protein APHAL10511_000502 [Amanita phalloides]
MKPSGAEFCTGPFLRENDSPTCIILHYLKYQPLARNALATLAPGVAPYEQHARVIFDSTGHPQPPSVILDFMYGVAAYKRWRPKGEGGTVESYKQRYVAFHNDTDDDGSPVEADDLSDGDYKPSDESSSGQEAQDTFIEAMDDMRFFLMYLSGISPEEAAMRKRLAQEASRKVTEWMKTVDVLK